MDVHLISPRDAAACLHVTPETLAVWRCTGRYDLKFVKVGRKVLYDKKDINSFIEQRKANKTWP